MPHPTSSLSISLVMDTDPLNPRDHENLGTMTCWHRRYQLGDPHGWSHPGAFLDHLVKALRKNHILSPVYLYDHSGLAFSTRPFSCPWDSGQIGFLWASFSKIRAWYGVKRVTAAIRQRVVTVLEDELKIYEHYVEGEVYGYQIHDANGNEIDSCYGYYGREACEQAAGEALKSLALS